MDEKWVRVSRKSPCRICEKWDYCTQLMSGKLARCMRVESEKPSTQGGWIHRINGEPVAAPKEITKLKNVGEIAKKMFNTPDAKDRRAKLAAQLGVSAKSLRELGVGVGYDRGGEFMSFPSRGVKGQVIGITRRYWDGEKKTMAGTSNGIFAVQGWWKLEGPICIVEGASDVAALFSHGLCGLGRPSNTGGVPILAEFLKRRGQGRKILVVGENDRKPERMGLVGTCDLDCAGCAWCWPGRYGAMATAKALGVAWRMVPAAHKDMRAWSITDGFEEQFLEWVQS